MTSRNKPQRTIRKKTGARPPETGPRLYPYQRRWIEDDSRFKIACKARQIGFTFAAAWRVLDQRLRRPGLTVWLSASERQALEAMEHIRRFARELRVAAVEEEEFVEGTLVKQYTVRFPNTSRIVGLPANPDTVRGFAGDVVLDEFAFHRDADAIWRAAFATATRGFQIEVISTPNGTRGKYYQLARAAGLVDYLPPSGGSHWAEREFEEGKSGSAHGPVLSGAEGLLPVGPPPIASSPVGQTFLSADTQGAGASPEKSLEGVRGKPFFRKVPPVSSASGAVWSAHWVDLSLARAQGFAVDVESLRAAIADDDAWQQEYCCRFLSHAAHYLPPELVAAAEHPAATTALELWDRLALAVEGYALNSRTSGHGGTCPERSRGDRADPGVFQTRALAPEVMQKGAGSGAESQPDSLPGGSPTSPVKTVQATGLSRLSRATPRGAESRGFGPWENPAAEAAGLSEAGSGDEGLQSEDTSAAVSLSGHGGTCPACPELCRGERSRGSPAETINARSAVLAGQGFSPAEQNDPSQGALAPEVSSLSQVARHSPSLHSAGGFVGRPFRAGENPDARRASTEGVRGNPVRVSPLAGRWSPVAAYFLGVDIGRRRDLTVLWLIEVENPFAPPEGRIYWTRGVLTLERAPFSRQRATLDALLAHRLPAQPESRRETFLKKDSPRTPSKDFYGDAPPPGRGVAHRGKKFGESARTLFQKGSRVVQVTRSGGARWTRRG